MCEVQLQQEHARLKCRLSTRCRKYGHLKARLQHYGIKCKPGSSKIVCTAIQGQMCRSKICVQQEEVACSKQAIKSSVLALVSYKDARAFNALHVA